MMDNYFSDSRTNLVVNTSKNTKSMKSVSFGCDSGNSFSGLKKGQHVTGIVIKTGDQVTFSIGGNEIAAPKGMYKNAKLGDTKDFEVLRASDKTVELGAADPADQRDGKTFIAVMRNDTDGSILLSIKDQLEKQTEREKSYQDKKEKMDRIASKMTEQDYTTLTKDGFPVEDYTVDGLDSALDRVKADTSSAGIQTPKMSSGTAAPDGNTSITENSIKDLLANANLPVTKDSVQKVTTALAISDNITNLDDKAIKYLIGQGLPPTIENLYKAQYSNNVSVAPKALSEDAWEELKPQVEEVIKEAGYGTNQDNMERAKWLIENQLPLTKESFTYLSELKDMEVPADKKEVLNKVIDGMQNGTAPKDVELLLQNEASYDRMISDINSIRGETIDRAVQTTGDLSIKVLSDIQKAADEKAQTANEQQETSNTAQEQYVTNGELQEQVRLNDEQQLAAIKAQRQLEEIRLKMTAQAAAAMEKKGFHIETQSLEKVVEELREMEDSYYRKLLSEVSLEQSPDNMSILKDTTQSLEQLKMMPSYILGTTLSSRQTQTVPGLIDAGNKLLADLQQASASYETLMTVPDSEYGDSIQKAFRNSDSLLNEMGLENTQYNQRAVRILGYNRMEINQESIDKVKAYDLEVNTLIDNLKPAVTIRLIKEGINPMDVPIGELNQKIDTITDEQGISETERFSTYLQKLEKETELPETEKNAYIGIYRLLYNIQKTDGAALGAVINSGREITLNNLLSAVRTIKKGNINAAVDDNFGSLQSASHEKETISQQIEPAFANKSGQSLNKPAGQNMNSGKEAQEEFMNKALKQLYKEAAPEKLNQIWKDSLQSSRQNDFAPLLSSDRGSWDTIKDMPVEALYDYMKSAGRKETENSGDYEESLEQIREAYKNPDQAVRFLDDFKIPCTTTNLLLAGQYLSNGGSAFQKLYKLRDENTTSKTENCLKKMKELSDTLVDKDTVNETYDELETETQELFSGEMQSEKIDSFKLAQLKSINLQMSFIKSLAKKEVYQIPVETKSGITNVNLTILRGTKEAGKVTVSTQSDQLGRIKADLSLKDNTLNGYIACDSRDGVKKLQTGMSELETVLKEENIEVKNLDVGYQKIENDTYTYQNSWDKKEVQPSDPETERILYRIAKGVISMVRTAQETV